MAITKRGKGKTWHIYFRPFGEKLVWVSTGTSLKSVAETIEKQIAIACKSRDYGFLDPEARAVCLTMFHKQRWPVPTDLAVEEPVKQLTFCEAVEMCLSYPGIGDSPNRARHEAAFDNIEKKWGEDLLVEEITTERIERYQVTRTEEKAAASTVNKERSALSLMFKVLMKKGLIDHNPVSGVKGLSERDGMREVYISFKDFSTLLEQLPVWMQPIVQTLYFTGMRRGEAIGMTWDNINLESRIIRLDANQTKERKRKRVPVHKSLLPALLHCKRGNVRSISGNHIFLMPNGHPPNEDSLRKPWTKAAKAVGFNPTPVIHDLRHVWKTNAMRSRIDFEVREAIMGHTRGIAGRYGRMSDEYLVGEIDRLTFDHGRTEIWVARKQEANEDRYCKNIASSVFATEPKLAISGN